MFNFVRYRKEFEDIILKGKLQEALKSLAPNSKEEIYVKFCEEFKKCSSEKIISKDLENILERAKEKQLPSPFIYMLETRKDLLEYDLPSTSQHKKDQIIDSLYTKYCGERFDYNTPFFVREKKTEIEKSEKNNTPTILTEEIINNAIDINIKFNQRIRNYKILNTPMKKRIKVFLEMINSENPLLIRDIINGNIQLPFYLMTTEEFTEIIKLLNESDKNISGFPFNDCSIEQLERTLKEINNHFFIHKKEIINVLISKKYNSLLKEAIKKNNLENTKKILWDIYELCKEHYKNLCSIVLLYILKINRELNILDYKPLILYIENPIRDYSSLQNDFYRNSIKNDESFSNIYLSGIDFNEINKHEFIEKIIIDLFINNKSETKNFKNYFNQQYLEKLEYIANIYKGNEVKFDSRIITKNEYEKIIKEIKITICEHNKKEFKIEEDVILDFDFKNVKEINLSIYEINTENYYLTKNGPITSLINVEGIIATNTMNIKIEGGENSLKRIRKKITLDKISKEKPGVYLIEILGNGISSRIIIKKGRLNLISRNTSKGILCQIINEKNEVVKGDNTYLWYNGIKFNCEKKEGLIVIPYKALKNNKDTCIICHEDYADITKIKPIDENYKLKGYFNIINEAIIPGNMLKVNFKPKLYINGREASLELIQDGTIVVDMKKEENTEILPITSFFENISFTDDNKEYEFEILIPPMMKEMIFSFKCKINNSITGKKEEMKYIQNSDFDSCNNKMQNNLFRRVGKNYIYETLGRNGENIITNAGKNTNIEVLTNYYSSKVNISLQYDEKGKLNLGELKNVDKIYINNNCYNLMDYSKYVYPERIDIVPGENFTLPIYSNSKFDDNYFIFYQYYSRGSVAVLLDNKKYIEIKRLNINEDNEHYAEFTVSNLPIGKYILSFGNSENKEIKIKIKVHEGIHWKNYENYIINQLGFIENSQIKTPIYLKTLNIDKKNGVIKFECSKTKRSIKNIHANIYLSQFQLNETNTYFENYYNMLNDGVEKFTKKKFTEWKNIYLSNRILNEEIQYVLQRRNLVHQLGNSLKMPSLLLKKTFKKDCFIEEEKLEKGNQYKKLDADIGKGVVSSSGKPSTINRIRSNTDFFNFLKYPSYICNNIQPINQNSDDKEAKFEIKFNDKEKDLLQKYSYIQIILIDDKSISTNLQYLAEDNYEILKRDITNEKSFDNSKNLSEIKKTELIKKNQIFNINETANYKLVDSIKKLSQFYLLTLNKNYWDKFKFIFELEDDKFNEEQFLEKYNEVFGHEINLYLYFKYPKLFDKYVKNILKYKFEKTFIDYFLLDDYETIIQYLNPIKISKLDTSELCLLILKIVEKKPDEARKIRNIIETRVKKSKEIENILLTNFSIMMNMKIEEDPMIKILKKEIKEEIIEESPAYDNQVTYQYNEHLVPYEGSSLFGNTNINRNRSRGNGRNIMNFNIMNMNMNNQLNMMNMNNQLGMMNMNNQLNINSYNNVNNMNNMMECNMVRYNNNMAMNSMPMNSMSMNNMSMNNNMAMNSMPMNYNMAMNNNNSMMMASNFMNQMPTIPTSALSNLCQVDFMGQERGNAFKRAVEKSEIQVGTEFEKPGKAREYKERHYYIKEHHSQEIDNPLWLDFAEYILSNKTHINFLSKNLLYNNINFNEFLLILSILDIPVESMKHEYKRIPGSRLVSINPASNLILFTKELIETQLNINNKLLISQNLIDKIHNEENVNTNNCTTNINYTHQTIVTNISNQALQFELFIQIPQGAICLYQTYYTNTIKIILHPYETKNHSIQFYFPKEGKFTQYHPIACKNSTIISVGNSLEYIVTKEYIPTKKLETIENNKYAKDMHIEAKLRNILSDDLVNSNEKIENILKYFNNDIINYDDISNILYLLKGNKDFYEKFIKTLKARGYYDGRVWSFGFYHKDPNTIKEYLNINNKIKNDVGLKFNSSLFKTSDIDEAKNNPHLEYSPLYNARTHSFGNKNDNSESSIANKEFRETYDKFIISLLSLPKLEIREKLQLTYYLILQDRMDEAYNIYKNIKEEEIEDINKKSIFRSFKIQYDYINAYLDFCFGYPEFTIAKSLCNKYKDFPLIYWKEKFEEIEDQLFEYEGKEKVSMNKISSEDIEKDKKLINKELREKEPKMSFNIDKNGKIILLHSNISFFDIKFYFIDLETMFTRDPKISEIMNKNDDKNNNNKRDYFGYVQPNYEYTLKIDDNKINKNDNITEYEIPNEYKNKNLFIEIKADSLKLFDIYLSSNLFVIITESIGELKVIDNNMKPVIKSYVKIYVSLENSEQIQFYKDGYTDLNGKFNYLALNTDQLKKAKKFYIYVSEEKKGAIIKECNPPKLIGNSLNKDNVLDELENIKRATRNEWRLANRYIQK